MSPETPDADAAEQARQADELVEEDESAPADRPLDADPADLADQQREVPVDDAYEHD
jgi:hypothetical protein